MTKEEIVYALWVSHDFCELGFTIDYFMDMKKDKLLNYLKREIKAQ